jgi:hypothetical protein
VYLLKVLIKLTITVIKPLKGLWLGVVVSLMLPLSVMAEQMINYGSLNERFDKNEDGTIDQIDWRKMKDDEKRTYARLSLEAIGENPDAIVRKGQSREAFLLEGLEAIYGK